MSIRFIRNRITVNFEELDGSPEEMVTSTWAGSGATRELKCRAADRIKLVNELLGYRQGAGTIGITGPQNMLIYLPAPYGPDMPNLTATSVVVKPYGKVSGVSYDTRWADYEDVTIDVNYEWNKRIRSLRYGYVTLTERMLDITEFVTLPVKGLYWGTAPTEEEIDIFDAPSKINYTMEWTYTITGAYTVPAHIFDYVGYINSVAVNAGSIYAGRTFPAWTLLYTQPEVTSEVTAGGTIYRIVLRFLYKNNDTTGIAAMGWNYFPRISASGADITYERITDGVDVKNFYAGKDFRDVFV